MQKILIANHKMNMSRSSYKEYFRTLKKITKHTNVKVGVCVPYPYLYLAEKYLSSSKIMYGAQDISAYSKGAHTGEVSISMVEDYNTNLQIVGHSETRGKYNDTEINKKLILSSKDMFTILCIGETKEQHEKSFTKKVLSKQLDDAFVSISDFSNVIIAYEPIYAIGTGQVPNVHEIFESVQFIKDFCMQNFHVLLPVLYGGSVDQHNISTLVDISNVDGFLVGGASTDITKMDLMIKGIENHE